MSEQARSISTPIAEEGSGSDRRAGAAAATQKSSAFAEAQSDVTGSTARVSFAASKSGLGNLTVGAGGIIAAAASAVGGNGSGSGSNSDDWSGSGAVSAATGALELWFARLINVFRVSNKSSPVSMLTTVLLVWVLLSTLTVPIGLSSFAQPWSTINSPTALFIIQMIIVMQRTLGLQFAPTIEAREAVIGAVAILHILTFLCGLAAVRLHQRGQQDLATRFVHLVRISCVITFVFAMPLTYFTNGITACDYTTGRLRVDGSSQCWDFRGSVVGFLALLAIFTSCTISILASTWIFISAETNPARVKWNPFVMDSPVTLTIDVMLQVLCVFVNGVAFGNTNYLIAIRYIIHIATVCVQLVITMLSMPFFSPFTNAAYFGLLGARLLLASGMLILGEITVSGQYPAILPVETSTTYVICYVAVVAGTIVIGFAVFFLAGLCYQALCLVRTRKLVDQLVKNRLVRRQKKAALNGNQSLAASNVESGYGSRGDSDDESPEVLQAIRDIVQRIGITTGQAEIACRFIQGNPFTSVAEKNKELDTIFRALQDCARATAFESGGLLVQHAITMLFFQGNGNYSYFLLRRAIARLKPNLFTKLRIYTLIDILDTETPGNIESERMSKALKSIQGNQYGIMLVQKLFWKTLMEDEGKSALDRLGSLAEHLDRLRQMTKGQWEVFSNNRMYARNPKALRMNAKFLEDVDNDTDTAALLYAEADELEGLSSISPPSSSRAAQIQAITARVLGKRLPSPPVNTPNSLPPSSPTRSLPRENPFDENELAAGGEYELQDIGTSPRTPPSAAAGQHVMSSTSNEETPEKLERELDQIEMLRSPDLFDVEASRRFMFRNNIANEKPSRSSTLLVLMSIASALLFIIAVFVLTMICISLVTLNSFVGDSCNIQSSSGWAAVRPIRFVQIANELGFIKDPVQLEYASRVAFLAFNKTYNRLAEFTSVYGDEILKYPNWTSPLVTLRIPARVSKMSELDGLKSPYTADLTSLQEGVSQFQRAFGRILARATNRSMSLGTYDMRYIWGDEGVNVDELFMMQDFALMWANSFTFNMIMQNNCASGVQAFGGLTQALVPVFFGVLAGIIAARLISLLVLGIGLTRSMLSRRLILSLFQENIPKDIVAKLFRSVNDKLKVISKDLGVSIDDVPQFSDIRSYKANASQALRTVCLYVLFVVLEIVFAALAIASFMTAYQYNNNKALVLSKGADTKRAYEVYSMFVLEMWGNNNTLLFEMPNAYKTSIRVNATSILQQQFNALESIKYFMLYGPNGDNGMISAQLQALNQLLEEGSCINSDHSTNPILARGLGIDGNILPVFQECLPSLKKLWADSDVMQQTIANSFPNAFDANFTMSSMLADMMYNTFITNTKLTEMIDFITLIYQNESVVQSTLQGVTIALFILELVLMGAIGIAFYFSYNRLVRRDHALRMLLNWIPHAVLDSNEALRNFVLMHKVQAKRSRNSLARDIADAAKARSVLQACADGVVLVAQEGSTIADVNKSACEMLGYSPAEIVGLDFAQLIDYRSRQDLENTLKHLIGKVSSNSKIRGDELSNDAAAILEISCVRKDGYAFPARISLNIGSLNGNMTIAAFIRDTTAEKKQKELLELEKANSDSLLLNILPRRIAARLKAGETSISDRYDDVTCLFSDLVGFTAISSKLNPQGLVYMLNALVSEWDATVSKLGAEKIKTIGDAYFAVCGIDTNNQAQRNHPEIMVRLGLEMLRVVKEFNDSPSKPANIPRLQLRVGIHTGPVTAGVIGRLKYAFDCFGDTVNVASRMESTGVPGAVQISRETYSRTFDMPSIRFEERHDVQVKGKSGGMTTYLIHYDQNTSAMSIPAISPGRFSLMLDQPGSVERRNSKLQIAIAPRPSTSTAPIQISPAKDNLTYASDEPDE